MASASLIIVCRLLLDVYVVACMPCSCPDCEHRLFLRSGSAAVKCPKVGCLKYVTKGSLSLTSLEEQEYEREISVRETLQKT